MRSPPAMSFLTDSQVTVGQRPPTRKGGGPLRAEERSSAALDARGVVQDAAAAVLGLGDQGGRATLLDRQVPGARGEFGDLGGGAVLGEEGAGHRDREPERREV